MTDDWRRFVTPHRLLIVIAVLYAISALPFALRAHLLTWDEVVYASQFATGTRAAPMSAPRAWGMPLLLAPIDLFTPSVLAIRLYVTALSGIGLYLAFRPWLRVVGPWVAPVAAGLFATLWTTVLYGAMGYPNLWLAFAVVAGVGYVCRGLAGPSDRWALAGMLTTFAIASMLRPTDASFLAVPLLVVCLARRAWRPLFAVSSGLAVGWIAWFSEAFLRFGGPIERLSRSSQINDVTLGFHPLPMLQSLDGPNLLCRPVARCTDIHVLEVTWWFLLPLLALMGIIAARHRLPYLLAASSAACLALSYVLTIDWFSARFLLPTYALLALPVACALVAAVRWRRAMAVVIAVALMFHVGTQVLTYRRVVNRELRVQAVRVRQVRTMEDQLGVRAPCVIFGTGAIEMSFVTHCRPVPDSPAPQPTDPRVQHALAAGEQVVLIVQAPDAAPPAVSGWQLARLSATSERWAYVADSPAVPDQP